jgi:hypothetical protein
MLPQPLIRRSIDPPLPLTKKRISEYESYIYNGAKFTGSQKSKGNSYDVEVVLQV